MNPGWLKAGWSIVEITVGIACIGISIYFLNEFRICNRNAEFCKPLAMLPVLLLLLPGMITCIAGTLTFSNPRLAFWKVRAAEILLLVLYYAAFLVIVYLNRN